MKLLIILLLIHSTVAFKIRTPMPIVMWHGLGDTCCMPISTGLLRQFLLQYIPNVYIHSLEVGTDAMNALENSYFLDPNLQVNYACKVLKKDKYLKNGFNMIGFGQGGLLLRAVIERCGHKLPPVKNFISIGSPQRGINGIPRCLAVSHKTCDSVRYLLKFATYKIATQHALVPAAYWNDPLRHDEYKKGSIFLADINNERTNQSINELYRSNLSKLKNFVMVKFENDSVVQPRESQWFGYYVPGQDVFLQTLHESKIYLEDRLGLQKMNQAGKLVFLSAATDHLQFEHTWFLEYIMPYLVDKELNQYLIEKLSPANLARNRNI